MKVDIFSAPASHSPILERLLELYCFEFSTFLQTDVDDQGRFGYPYLDLYWQEANRHPFLIQIKGQYAGFVLVNQVLQYVSHPDAKAIAEFFIMPKYRRKGIGIEVAHRIFRMFPGWWEVSAFPVNQPALHFWQHTINRYTDGQFEQVETVFKHRVKQIFFFEK
ncbi:MAG: GNAT family N-acetyltransferase [Bacteroidota bacterium]